MTGSLLQALLCFYHVICLATVLLTLIDGVCTLLEEMVLFRTRNGSIPRFIYGTPKWFYI